jgi:hypothetical protein
MAKGCTHMAGIRSVTPSALGCQECLKSGSVWLHLRICRTQHPIIKGYDPPERWGWCHIDQVLFDLSNRKTPHNGPIPRCYKGGFQC